MGKDDHLKTKETLTPAESIVCGGAAGLISRFVISPLDVVKIRLQLQTSKHAKGEFRLGTAVFHNMARIVRSEGIRALWKGNVPAELMYVMYGAAQFTAYKNFNRLCNIYIPEVPENVHLFISGAMAGTLATAVTYPFDLLRTRFAAQSHTDRIYTSLLQSFRHIYVHEGGVRGYFRGLMPAIYSVVPNMGIFFMIYEETRRIMRNSVHLDVLPAPEATAGFVAGTIAKTTVFPLDTVRKRLQVQGPTKVKYSGGSIPTYSSNVFKCGRQIFVHEGIRGLYKGYFVSLMKTAPSSAVTIWAFERAVTVYRFFGALSEPRFAS